MVFCPRAMFTVGITRETSPALWPAACGSAKTSAGTQINADTASAIAQAYGDFGFMATLLGDHSSFCTLLLEQFRTVNLKSGWRFASATCAGVKPV
jgi:hypothetical protein